MLVEGGFVGVDGVTGGVDGVCVSVLGVEEVVGAEGVDVASPPDELPGLSAGSVSVPESAGEESPEGVSEVLGSVELSVGSADGSDTGACGTSPHATIVQTTTAASRIIKIFFIVSASVSHTQIEMCLHLYFTDKSLVLQQEIQNSDKNRDFSRCAYPASWE